MDMVALLLSTRWLVRMPNRKWRENKLQLIWWPDLAVLCCILVSLHILCDIPLSKLFFLLNRTIVQPTVVIALARLRLKRKIDPNPNHPMRYCGQLNVSLVPTCQAHQAYDKYWFNYNFVTSRWCSLIFPQTPNNHLICPQIHPSTSSIKQIIMYRPQGSGGINDKRICAVCTGGEDVYVCKTVCEWCKSLFAWSSLAHTKGESGQMALTVTRLH